MSSRRRTAFIGRLTPAALLAAVLIGGGQPALAATQLSRTGTVGTHSIEDTTLSPGATCRYQHEAPGHFGKLVKIVVQPPNMHAVAGKSSQTVGWTFEVQRRLAAGPEGPPGPWQHRYTSTEMKSVTDDSHDAAFTSASVPVIAGHPQAGGGFEYRVLVTMFWHLGDGSVQGTVKERIDFYKDSENTGPTAEQDHECDAWVSFS